MMNTTRIRQLARVLKASARKIRLDGAQSMSDGHRLSETMYPATCSCCSMPFPCRVERHARKLLKEAAALTREASMTGIKEGAV